MPTIRLYPHQMDAFNILHNLDELVKIYKTTMFGGKIPDTNLIPSKNPDQITILKKKSPSNHQKLL